MDPIPPQVLIRQVEQEIAGVLSAIDTSELERHPRALVGSLKNQIIDARLDVRDYEYAETRSAQHQLAQHLRQVLEALRGTILSVSEYGIFSSVDVVRFSARLDTLIEQLQ